MSSIAHSGMAASCIATLSCGGTSRSRVPWISNSIVSIFGGLFESGDAVRLSGAGDIVDGDAIGAFNSVITMSGGETNGTVMLWDASELIIVGTDLSYTGGVLSGRYGNDDPFSHNVILNDGSTITFQAPPVPEPATAALGLLSLLGLGAIAARRRAV